MNLKAWAGVLVAVLAVTFTMEAEAQRRLGGGRSIGKQAPAAAPKAAPTPPSAAAPGTSSAATSTPGSAVPGTPATSAAAPGAAAPAAAGASTMARGPAAAAPASPMRGLLMGAAAGLGLAALASWLGFGEAMGQILLLLLLGLVLAVVVGFVLRRLRGAPAPQPVAAGGVGTLGGYGVGGPSGPAPEPLQRRAEPAVGSAGDPVASAPTWSPVRAGARPGSAMDEFMSGGAVAGAAAGEPAIPAGFDTEGFLAQARQHFAELQTAWDRSDLDALSGFTTQEMFTALTHELRARGPSTGPSEVKSLEASLLSVTTAATEYVASVRFTGTLSVGGEVEPLDEVWNLTKPRDGTSGWLLAGIQQLG